MQASLPAGSERSPSRAAVNSMRLLVVWRSPPESSNGSRPPGAPRVPPPAPGPGPPPESSTGSAPSGPTTIAAQPPGPGLPLQAPSVQTRDSPGRCSTGVSAGAGRRGGGRAEVMRPSILGDPAAVRLLSGESRPAAGRVVAGGGEAAGALV